MGKLGQFKHRPAVLFFLASLFIFYFLSNHSYNADEGKLKFTYPTVFSGDEPHYLVIISSILLDGDLSLANNYQSVRMGGMDAGQRFKGTRGLDHHTLIKDVRTGEAVLWEKVFDYSRPVDCAPSDLSCVGFKRISDRFPDYTLANPNYIELPKHPVAFPALLAILLKIFGTRIDQVEAHAIYLQVLLSWFVGIITYICALQLGLGSGGSLGVVSLLYFASPWLVYSRLLFPATFMGLLLIVALWAFMYKRFAVSAAFLTVASLQSEAFVLIFPAWAVLLYLSNEKRSTRIFATASAISIALASLINYFLLGKITIRDMHFILDPVLMWRTFVEPGTGVWVFFPWSIPVFCFLILSFWSRNRDGSRALQAMAAGIFPVAAVYMILPATGQFCYGPRYWVPYIPWLSLGFVLGMKNYSDIRPTLIRPILFTLVGLSVIVAVTASVLPGSTTWHQPPWRVSGVLLRHLTRN